ncbi:MAG: aryl-sulfate sulfotransferase [Bacteroidota bacterium]
MKKILLSFLFGCLFLASSLAQDNTVGLLSYNPDFAYEGYNLIYPHNQPNVYLLNNCGEIVHVWEDSAQFRPGNTAYIQPNGNLVKAKRLSSVAGDAIWAGGGGAIIEIRSWDNDLLWSFEMNDTINRLHHDFTVTPEGTIIAIAWELKTYDEAVQAGRDTALLPSEELWPDWVFEIDPSTDEIIWEWHAWDHLVQDFDDTKDNFGVIADNPQRLDVNFNSNNGDRDWMHCNAIDFNPELDQIIISSPFLREVYIIDHSTTTQQAAGSAGGLSGLGGDFMFRWGNLQAYDQGTDDDQKLFNNHDVRWVDDFVSPSNPNFGKLSVFNNLAGPDFSTFNIINPPWDMYSNRYLLNSGVWGPADFDVNLTHPTPTDVYSSGLSSMQVLDNGNYLICSGRQGYAFELTPSQEIVWEYITPLNGGQPVNQGDTLDLNDNLTFRMDRYPVDFIGFENRDLSPKGWIELNPDTNFCDTILPVFTQNGNYQIAIYPNPADGMVTIEWHGGIWVEVDVVDLMGRQVITPMRLTGGRKYLDTSHLNNGLYFVRINGNESSKLLISR